MVFVNGVALPSALFGCRSERKPPWGRAGLTQAKNPLIQHSPSIVRRSNRSRPKYWPSLFADRGLRKKANGHHADKAQQPAGDPVDERAPPGARTNDGYTALALGRDPGNAHLRYADRLLIRENSQCLDDASVARAIHFGKAGQPLR